MDFVQIYLCINVFIIGALFGSFFSLANYRLPRKKDIVFTRSFCPKCNHNLGFFDLIPILSYILRGGKCKYCHDKISIRYITLEISTACVFLAIYLIFGFTWYTLIAMSIYIYLAMTTGYYINKKNMLNQKIDELNNDNMELSKKSGVFITEVIIAVVIFAISVGATYATYRGSITNMQNQKNQNVAVFECTKNVELALGIKYDDLNTFYCSSVIDGITYNTMVDVSKYSDDFLNKKDYIKIINAKTEYMYNGQSYTYEMKTIKKKVD